MTTVTCNPEDYVIPPYREDHGGLFTKEQYITDLADDHLGKSLAHAGDGPEAAMLTFGFSSESNARAFKDAMNSTFVPRQDGLDDRDAA